MNPDEDLEETLLAKKIFICLKYFTKYANPLIYLISVFVYAFVYVF